MLYTMAAILVALWIAGLATSYTSGGTIHILLLFAVLAIVFEFILGKEVIKTEK